MQQLIHSTEKMSSKRVAEKTGKEHKNVIRDIRVMLEELQKDGSNLSNSEYQIITDGRGFTSEILLNERLCLCLASGYSIKLRMAIIDDWAMMKAQQISPLPLSTEQQLAQAVLLATSVIAQKDEEIKLLKPKAEYTDVVLSSKSCHTTTEIAKELGMPSARELNSQLCQRGIQYKHRGHYVLTAKYADKKYTTTNTIAYVDSKGEVATREHMVWTEYGRVFLHNLFNSQLSFSKARKEVSHV